VVGNCLNRTIKMIGKYRGGVVPAPGDAGDLDAKLREQTAQLQTALADAYGRIALQDSATLPVDLARAANFFIDQTAPFSLAKDPAKASRLDTVLNLSAQAIFAALVGLLPILPKKAEAGLKQLGIDPAGKTLSELFAAGLPVGQKLGEGSPLFPKLDQEKKG
jgi:methionyl-tRNA synthetase